MSGGHEPPLGRRPAEFAELVRDGRGASGVVGMLAPLLLEGRRRRAVGRRGAEGAVVVEAALEPAEERARVRPLEDVGHEALARLREEPRAVGRLAADELVRDEGVEEAAAVELVDDRLEGARERVRVRGRRAAAPGQDKGETFPTF